jgi:hypothetical protein
MCINPLFDILSNTVITDWFLAIQDSFPIIYSKREIEEYPDDRQKNDHQQVGQGFGAGAGFINYAHTNRRYQYGIHYFCGKRPVH